MVFELLNFKFSLSNSLCVLAFEGFYSLYAIILLLSSSLCYHIQLHSMQSHSSSPYVDTFKFSLCYHIQVLSMLPHSSSLSMLTHSSSLYVITFKFSLCYHIQVLSMLSHSGSLYAINLYYHSMAFSFSSQTFLTSLSYHVMTSTFLYIIMCVSRVLPTSSYTVML